MKHIHITTSNYFDTIKKIGLENLPSVLQQSHSVIKVKTDIGKDWAIYKTDAELKRMIDLVFKKLEEFIASENKSVHGIDGIKKVTKKDSSYSGISKEIHFIYRFLEFHDKILYKKTFEIFIDELQKAIKEKQITKTSPVAKDIMAIQKAVLQAFNKMSNAKHFVLKPTTIKHLKGIMEKYENSYDDNDKEYLKLKKKPMDLSGVNQTEQESTPQVPVNIMPSIDFTNLQFNTIGFKDKWLDFIGNPAPGFTAMVFGMPKMGKSYLCIDFAGYLARNHGKVLYVAKEEKLDMTLQDKINDTRVAHENLTVADGIPNDLTNYDFIFLDSVNKLGLTSKDLEKLKSNNKGKSFVYVFQATKGGQFKGNNEFQHDVDVVIEIPERGKATQFGRFNQGGEMDIFPENQDVQSLEGISKRKAKQKDWTEPEYLNTGDHYALKKFKQLYDEGKIEEAKDYASNFETIIREEIPPEIWKAIGGQLTKTGEENLKKARKLLTRNKASSSITTELGIPLEELAMELIPKKQPKENIIQLIENETAKVESAVRKMAEQAIEDEGLAIKVVSVTFKENDSYKLSTGASYYTVILEGTKTELKKIAGEDKLFYYEW